MSTATTSTVDVADLIAKLKQREAALGDPLDVPRTTRAFEDYWKRRRAISAALSGLMNVPDDLAREQARLDDLEARRAEVVAEFARLETLIADAPDWRTISNASERDREFDRQRDLREARRRLENGTLLKSPTETYETLPYLDRQIAEIRDRRDRAQRALDGHLKAAAELLSAAHATS